MSRTYWCPSALTSEGWRDHVAIVVDDDGNITHVGADVPCGDASPLAGAVIPGIANLHSHAHQRAMAGLAERASNHGDSFWTWREAMYHYVERIGPEQLYAIARQLYVEMLKAGYTTVAEFQYLHHDTDGRPYADVAEMTLQCLAAAGDTGIAFTALPVLYRYGGFGEQSPSAAQRRFINDADGYLAIVEGLRDATAEDHQAVVGIAPHSLRAVSPALLDTVLEAATGLVDVIHVHIAEQRREVEDCLAHHGQRPVAWLLDHAAVDHRWCLVHATHVDPAEVHALAASGAVAGLCPTTEANLGDGLFPATAYLRAGGRFGVGSDSHVSVSPVEELRWLEYGVRLAEGTRNALATTTEPHTGQALVNAALAGGARACARQAGVIAAGARADWLVLDADHARLHGRQRQALIDGWVFSGNENLVRDVFVGGHQVIEEGHHADEEAIARDYRRAIDQLQS